MWGIGEIVCILGGFVVDLPEVLGRGVTFLSNFVVILEDKPLRGPLCTRTIIYGPIMCIIVEGLGKLVPALIIVGIFTSANPNGEANLVITICVKIDFCLIATLVEFSVPGDSGGGNSGNGGSKLHR